MTTELLKYIKTIIEDSYAMEVLFNSIKQKMIENDCSLEGVNSIKIDKNLQLDNITININHIYTSKLESFSILLSIRALMLHKEWISDCDKNMLLFNTNSSYNFGWIEQVSHIMDCMSDKLFAELFTFIKSIYNNGNLTLENERIFKNSIVVPKQKTSSKSQLSNPIKNAAFPKRKYSLKDYKELAKTKQSDVVIPNNAFVCNNTLHEYVITDSVAYIGNTAFAYCENLTSIVVQPPHVLFGKFPIIECPKLSSIVVPKGSEKYYKDELPYYKDIISSKQ